MERSEVPEVSPSPKVGKKNHKHKVFIFKC